MNTKSEKRSKANWIEILDHLNGPFWTGLKRIGRFGPNKEIDLSLTLEGLFFDFKIWFSKFSKSKFSSLKLFEYWFREMRTLSRTSGQFGT